MDSATATPAEVVVDPEYAAIIPPPTADELALLEESLVHEGCREPLLVMGGTDILLDGHNRYAICTRLGIPFEVKSIDIADRDEALVWIIGNQLGRRNLTVIDRIMLVERREPLLRARAAVRKGRRTDLPQNSAGGGAEGETREVAAAAAGVSHDTYTKGKNILQRGVPELVDAVRAGTASIHAAAQVAGLPEAEQRQALADIEAGKPASRRKGTSGSQEWYTPDPYLDAAREVLGGIDLDPASCTKAQERVRAKTYYSKKKDGLIKPWRGRVWLNPPFTRGLMSRFVQKLVDDYTDGDITAAILLTNSETETGWFQLAASQACSICLPRGRIRFLRGATGGEGSPQMGQALFYFGPDGDRFVEVFGKMGFIATPVHSVSSEDRAVEGDAQ